MAEIALHSAIRPTYGRYLVVGSYLYVMRVPELKLWKFGITDINPVTRMHSLQENCPAEIEIYGAIRTFEHRKLEAAVLKILAPWRVRSEWFRDSSQVRSIANCLRSDDLIGLKYNLIQIGRALAA